MKGSVIAINQEARVGVGRRPYCEAGMILPPWAMAPSALRAKGPGIGQGGKSNHKTDTGYASRRTLGPRHRAVRKKRPQSPNGLCLQARAWAKLARVYGLSPDKLARIFGGGKSPKSALGHALRQARLRAGLGVEEAARQMDVTAAAVRQWETGVNCPGWKSQQKIARVYGLSMEEVFRLLEEAGS